MKAETLPALLFEHASRTPGRVALREKKLGIWQEITWQDYWDHVENVCLGLLALGVTRGDRIAVLSDNNPEWVYTDLAAQLAGATTVGVYPTNPPRQVKYILGHSGAQIVVVGDQEQADKVLAVRQDLPALSKMVVIDMKGLWGQTDKFLLSFRDLEELGSTAGSKGQRRCRELLDQRHSDDLARIIYTSGTTGPPKGAMVSHRNLLATVGAMVEANGVRESDEIVSYLPLCHIAELCYSIVIPQLSGCTVNFAESIDTVQAALQEVFPTVFVAVPRIWEKLHSFIFIKIQDASFFKRLAFKVFLPMGKKRADLMFQGKNPPLTVRLLWLVADVALLRKLRKHLGLSRVRNCMAGAAALSQDIHSFFGAIGINIVQGYGLTEVSGITHVHRSGNVIPGTVGFAVSGVETKLADDGEILIRCEGLFQGYYRDERASRDAVDDGWLKTGDIGRFDDKGHLVITDRKKDILITSGGKNIAPTEIENRLKVSPYIKECVVVGDGCKYLCCLIQFDHENVANYCQRNNVPFTTFKSLADCEEVHELIDGEIRQANKDFSRVEQIKKFRLLTKELDHDDDELTATQKVRRKVISERYKEEIESMYRGST